MTEKSTPPKIPLPMRVRVWMTNLALVVSSLAVALLLTEGIIRFFFPIKQNEGHLLEDLSGDPIQYRLIPRVDAIYYGAPVTVNSNGYRGMELPNATSEEVLRVVVVGDSMTFGNGVGEKETYPYQLEEWFSDHASGWSASSANLGVPSYNTEQVAIQLEEMGLPLEPDLVIYGFFVNDAAPKGTAISWARPDPGIIQSLTEGSYLIRFLQNQIPLLLTTVRKGLGITARSEGYIEYFREGTPTWNACQNSLQSMRNLCQDAGIPFAVVLIPFWVDFENYPWEDCHRIVADELEELNVPVLDLAQAWADEGVNGRDYWIDIHQSHPTGEGYRLLVDTVGPFLLDQVWPQYSLHEKFPIQENER